MRRESAASPSLSSRESCSRFRSVILMSDERHATPADAIRVQEETDKEQRRGKHANDWRDASPSRRHRSTLRVFRCCSAVRPLLPSSVHSKQFERSSRVRFVKRDPKHASHLSVMVG